MSFKIFQQNPDLIPSNFINLKWADHFQEKWKGLIDKSQITLLLDGEKNNGGLINEEFKVLTWLDYGSSNQSIHFRLRHLHTGLVEDYRYPHQIVRCRTNAGTRYGILHNEKWPWPNANAGQISEKGKGLMRPLQVLLATVRRSFL